MRFLTSWTFWTSLIVGVVFNFLIIQYMLGIDYDSLVLWEQLIVSMFSYLAGIGLVVTFKYKLYG